MVRILSFKYQGAIEAALKMIRLTPSGLSVRSFVGHLNPKNETKTTDKSVQVMSGNNTQTKLLNTGHSLK